MINILIWFIWYRIIKFNRKTLDINEYKKYVKKKNEINGKLFDFYKNIYLEN